MLKKSWFDRLTEISAGEGDAIGNLLQKLFTPGVSKYGLGTPTLSFGGTTATIAESWFGDEGLITAVALCTAWYRNTFDFATMSPTGGALDAGTYDLYIDAKEVDLGGGEMQYQAWLRAAATGTVDSDTYLMIRLGVVWSGAAITDHGADSELVYIGALDLTKLGLGSMPQVVLGSPDRGIRFDGRVDFSEDVHVGLAAGVEIIAGDGHVTIDLGEASTVELDTNSRIDLVGAGAAINVSSGAAVRAIGGSVEATAGGAILAGPDGYLYAGVGSIFLADEPLQFTDSDTPAAPKQHALYGKSVVRAFARVHSDGTLLDSFNVDSVTAVGAGIYHVNFIRDFTAVDYVAIPAAISTAKRSAQVYQQLTNLMTIVTHKNEAGDDANINCAFSIIVFGGVQAA